MRVRDIMHRDVVTIGPDETLAAAARTLREHGISAVVVSECGAPIGILTERDFVQTVVDGDDPATVPVRQRMTTDLVTVESKADVEEAAELMAHHNIRHLPVVDHGHLAGIVSIRDPVMRHPALRRLEQERRQSVQARAADTITAFAGSMPFVYIHALWFGVWILARVEDYPFGLLTMIVSLEAIFLATFVMISQNRADQKRQALADHQWEIVQYEEKQNEELLRMSQQILDLTGAIHELTVLAEGAGGQPAVSG
jgi:CBS domain-containing protein